MTELTAIVADAARHGTRTIDFDSLHVPPMGRPVPDGYKGLDWSHLSLFYNAPSLPYGEHGMTSGIQVAGNDEGTSASFSTENGSFDLVSLNLSVAYAGRFTVTISGYADGELVGTKTVGVVHDRARHVHFDWQSVDTVTFSTVGPRDYYALDDVVISNVANDPAATRLVGSGVFGSDTAHADLSVMTLSHHDLAPMVHVA